MPLDIARQYMAQLAGTSAGQLAGSILNDHSRGLDPFEAAALRQRMGVRPDGGRKETTPGELDPITQTASDVLIPKSPLDVAMMALSGPFRLGTKVAALAAGGVLSSDEAHAGAIGKLVKGIRAFHGSPHDFDKFSLSKIGTGEGAQAYGHGLYFADNEGVAKSYRDALAGVNRYTINDKFLDTQSQLGGAIHSIFKAAGAGPNDSFVVTPKILQRAKEDYLGRLGVPGNSTEYTEGMDALLGKRLGMKQDPGRMYEVNINAAPEQFLDWDKPLSKMSQPVQEILQKNWLAHPDLDQTGSDIYRATMRDAVNKYMRRGNGAPASSMDDVASATLHNAGIPGIRYLDQGSRGAGEGSRNYVVFDDGLIDIIRKYGLAGVPAAGMLSAGSQDAEAGPLGAVRKGIGVAAGQLARKTERFEWPVKTEYGTNITMPITVNPSARDIAKELANAPHGDVRALKAPNGDVYLWPANEAMHRDIASTFDMPFKTRQDLQKSSYLFNSKDVDALGGFKSFDDLITRLGSQ